MTSTDPIDLLQFVARTAAELPQTEDDEPFRFLPRTLPDLPSVLHTDELIIRLGAMTMGLGGSITRKSSDKNRSMKLLAL